MTLQKSVLRTHRWLSLCFASFWAIQALTGVLIVFHWEIDDALLPGAATPLDPAAIERRIDELAPPGSGSSVGSVWESGGVAGRFDLYLDRPSGSVIVRVDGAGQVLRERADGEMLADGGWKDTLVVIHHNLLSGESGSWIVGLSGILLATNIVLGIALAWPPRGSGMETWQRLLLPRVGKRGGAGHAYAWHRAIGLWGAVPAVLMASAGTLLVFSGTVEALVGPAPVEAPEPKDTPPNPAADIGFASAVETALAAYPGATLSGVSMPDPDSPFYKVRVLQPGEWRQVYGTTTMYIDSRNATITARFDALTDGPRRSIVDGLFAFHTGGMGGLAGRLAVMATGLWLLTMMWLGVVLWRARRRR
jgi:uncharacterized iron-regulated membrane protein